MRTSIVLLISLFSIHFAFAQKQHVKLEIKHLQGDFYVFTTYSTYKGSLYPANGMYLLTQKGAVMIDAPWDSTQYQPLLDSIKTKHGKEVLMCIATHSHSDRMGGLQFLRQKGIKTYTTRQTDQICKRTGEKRAEFLIEKDTTFSVGEHVFQTYYAGPGHAPDNIVVWFEKERILYGGCLIKSLDTNGLGNMNDANVNQWTATIKKIQAKFPKPRFVIPGHEGWASTQSLNHTLGLIREYKKKNGSKK